jgi:TldD protein
MAPVGFRCAILLVVLGVLPASLAAQTRTKDAGDDPILSAMKAEMARSKEKLKLPDLQAPYYIEYSVADADHYSAAASFGALTTEQRSHSRVLSIVVRVGDYKQDNSFQGSGLVDLLPMENDVFAMRHAIWLATDRAYKQALGFYAAKQAMLRRYQTEQPVDDFSHEETTTYVGDIAKLEIGKQNWPQLLESLSSLYRSDPRLNAFNASVNFSATTRYFLNSEGTFTRKPEAQYRLSISGATQADDGMSLERNYGEVTPTLGELPSPEKLHSKALELLATLKQLREAPVVTDSYQGPVLFSGDSADSVFSELIANNVLGIKPQPGSSARTIGDYAGNYKSRILPPFLSVVDDPTIKSFQGEGLISTYEIDDEGVKARPVTVVDKGELVNYLTSRQPIRDFPKSNGHGRSELSMFGLSTTAKASTLLFKTDQATPRAQLKQKLIELCKSQGLPFGYYVETMAPPTRMPENNEEESEAAPHFAPRLLYRVYVNDGHEELVRGAEFGGLDTRALRTGIAAVGDDPFVEGAGDEQAPITIVSPSVLFSDLEVKQSESGKDKLPQYPPPVISAQ